MLDFENKAAAEAANISGGETVIQLLGFFDAGDGGGARYKRSATEPPHAGKLQDDDGNWWELAETQTNALMFGCDRTGTNDSGAAMKAFFDYCIDRTGTLLATTQKASAGHIPAGTYRIPWGTLVFDTAAGTSPTSPERLAWPTITTDGAHQTIFLGTGSVDAAMITLKNGAPTSAIDRTWMGGALGGLRILPSGSQSGKSARHGLSLSGVAYTEFGDIYCEDNAGSAVYIPNAVVDGSNPDPFHVAACQFAVIAGIRSSGRALTNLNGVGLTGCTIRTIRAIETGLGGVFGLGSANTFEFITLGSCQGWAVHDGFPSATPVTANRNRILAAELDDPEFGMCINKSQDSRFEKIRINHRFNGPTGARNDDLFWPKTAVLIAGEAGGAVENTVIEVRHRVDPFNINPAVPAEVAIAQAALGEFCKFGHPGNVGNVEVNQIVQNNTYHGTPAVPFLTITDEHLLIGESVHARAVVRVADRVIFDGIQPRMASVTYDNAGGEKLDLPMSGFSTKSSILAMNKERFDPHGDFDITAFDETTNPGGYGFKVPYSGYAEVNLSLMMASSAGSRFQLGVLINRGGTYFSAAMRRYKVTADSLVQSFQFNQVVPVLAGDILYAAADQNSGAVVESTGIYSIDDIQFQVRLI